MVCGQTEQYFTFTKSQTKLWKTISVAAKILYLVVANFMRFYTLVSIYHGSISEIRPEPQYLMVAHFMRFYTRYNFLTRVPWCYRGSWCPSSISFWKVRKVLCTLSFRWCFHFHSPYSPILCPSFLSLHLSIQRALGMSHEETLVGQEVGTNGKECQKDPSELSAFNQKVNTMLHKCHYCDKFFSTAGNLKMHVRTHSGEKSKKCNQCDYATSRADHFRVHLRTQ